nr:choice-of-anchor J domain-containing protein [uncultured Carboxylicivirga sp.]
MTKTSTLFLSVAMLASSFTCFGKTAVLEKKDVVFQTTAEAASLPFSETFDTEAALDNWTIQDNNGGSAWRYFQENVAYLLDPEQQADDYLISPVFELSSDKMYRFSYQATTPPNNDVIESFSVVLIDQESNQTVLVDYPSYVDSNPVQKELTINVPESGEYQFAFFVYSQPERFRLEIDNVELVEAGNKNAPNSITDLNIEAAENGQLSANISFTVPSLTWAGEDLTEVSKVEIFRGEATDPVYVFNDVLAGDDLQWIDNDPDNGFNTYRVVASNTYGDGPVTEKTIYIGIDTPVGITQPLLEKFGSKARITWTAPTSGINNSFINSDELTYRIVKNGTTEIANGINATIYTDETPNQSEGQAAVYYEVYAKSVAGESVGVSTNTIIFGEPIIAPFKESFANTQATNIPWTSVWVEGDNAAQWSIVDSYFNINANPQDNDGGMILFNSWDTYEGGTSRMVSPAIDISSMSNPVVGFWMFHYDDESGYEDFVKMQVSADNGAYEDVTDPIYMAANSNGWTYYEASLINYKNSGSINLGILGVSGYGYNMLIDNISIYNAVDNDLKVISVEGPKRVNINDEVVYKALIKNAGATATSNYQVVFSSLPGTTKTIEGVTIDPDQTHEFEFSVKAGLEDVTTGDDYYNYSAEILFDADEDQANNISEEYHVTVRKPSYPQPQSLDATVNQTEVSLSWLEPEMNPTPVFETVTEDFESYMDFVTRNFGDWTTLDLDGDATLVSPILGEYPNQGKPMAFQVFNSESFADDEIFEAHSGKKYLVSPASDNVANNNWLISPMLSSKAQNITFWAKQPTELYGNEHMVIWYSTTDKHPDSFIKLSEGDYVSMPYIYWHMYTYSLPEGAKYFAIQSVSEQTLYLAIDDITYENTDVDPEVVQLLGYNIYRDNELLNTELLSEPAFTDEPGDGSYKYKVTAVYDKGESYNSNEVDVTVDVSTAIGDIDRNAVKIYSVEEAVIVKNAVGKDIQLYTVDGRLVGRYAGEYTTNIHCSKGVYLVKVENTVQKVVVR